MTGRGGAAAGSAGRGATPGVYLLTVRVPRAASWQQAGETLALPPGWYVYTGSAMGGLEGRLRRHLTVGAVRHWHLDWLLGAGRVVDIQALPCREKTAECRLAAAVGCWAGAQAVAGFGCSDCGCVSHLQRFDRRPGGSLRAPAVLAGLQQMMAALAERYADYTATAHDPFRTLVACILSLRTRDAVAEAAAGRLLARWRQPQDLAAADRAELADCIRPVGMYRQKAAHLIAIAAELQQRHGGAVPAAPTALLALPGVGPKTANLVLSFAFGQAAICVDTHVHRICNRWGLIRTASPADSERELRAVVPEGYWGRLNPFLVQHGQRLCLPRRPRCSDCPLVGACAYDGLRAERAILGQIGAAPPHPCLGRHLAAPPPPSPTVDVPPLHV